MFVDSGEVHQSYSFDSLNFIELSSAKGPLLLGLGERAVGRMDDEDRKLQSCFKSIGINKLILCSPHAPIVLSCHMADRYFETLYPWLQSDKTFDQFEWPRRMITFLFVIL